jgi:hypothetical protein
MSRILLYVFLPLFLFSCSEDEIVDATDNSVMVSFELQSGFESKTVRISIDSIIYFQASLSSGVPFAGPEAQFSTILSREKHILIVSWWESFATYRIDSVEFALGQSAKYFIGLNIISDTLSVDIRDSSYLYGHYLGSQNNLPICFIGCTAHNTHGYDTHSFAKLSKTGIDKLKCSFNTAPVQVLNCSFASYRRGTA